MSSNSSKLNLSQLANLLTKSGLIVDSSGLYTTFSIKVTSRNSNLVARINSEGEVTLLAGDLEFSLDSSSQADLVTLLQVLGQLKK